MTAAPKSDTVTGTDGRARCRWVGSDPEYLRYHDDEWGFPLRGDRQLFEKLSLEGFQAGLSWITILKRRPAFRELFHGFDIAAVARMTPEEVESLMQDTRIIRNRAKIQATITNARITRELDRSLDDLLWGFAPPARANRLTTMTQVPAVTDESIAMSGALRALGYRFVGPTTMYALMQSTGMVDDHVAGCWRAA